MIQKKVVLAEKIKLTLKNGGAVFLQFPLVLEALKLTRHFDEENPEEIYIPLQL